MSQYKISISPLGALASSSHPFAGEGVKYVEVWKALKVLTFFFFFLLRKVCYDQIIFLVAFTFHLILPLIELEVKEMSSNGAIGSLENISK